MSALWAYSAGIPMDHHRSLHLLVPLNQNFTLLSTINSAPVKCRHTDKNDRIRAASERVYFGCAGAAA